MESLDSDVELELGFVVQETEMGSDGNESGTNIEKKDNKQTAQSIKKNQVFILVVKLEYVWKGLMALKNYTN